MSERMRQREAINNASYRNWHNNRIFQFKAKSQQLPDFLAFTFEGFFLSTFHTFACSRLARGVRNIQLIFMPFGIFE
jgi:hypothetical protein